MQVGLMAPQGWKGEYDGWQPTDAWAREDVREAGSRRVDLLGRFVEIGLDRIVAFPTRWAPTTEAQAAFADDCRAAGLSLSAGSPEFGGPVAGSPAPVGQPA